ncbi:MAG: hypothetical protein IPH75_00005, partial [bacterium]|nr:hypothetical protein [bacterium]
ATTPYRLTVPLRAEGANIAETTSVLLSSAEVTADFVVSNEVTSLAVDPDFHLFRRLYPEEVEPIISAVLGVERKELLREPDDQTGSEAFTSFGSAITEGSVVLRSIADLDALPHDCAPIIMNPMQLPDYLAKQIVRTKDSVTIGGATWSLADHTVIMAGQNWNGFGKYLVVITGDYSSLPRVGQLVPHYGKYSYLVFAGAKNVAKGQWPVTDSPLRKILP